MEIKSKLWFSLFYFWLSDFDNIYHENGNPFNPSGYKVNNVYDKQLNKRESGREVQDLQMSSVVFYGSKLLWHLAAKHGLL